MKKLLAALLSFACLATAFAQQPAKPVKAAIFVANRAGAAYDAKMNTLEDLLTARVASNGFQVLSREVVVNALQTFDPAIASAPRPADSLDTKLSEQSSALRLGQNLGADYLLIAVIDSIGTKKRNVDAYGAKFTTIDSNLRATYKVIDGNTGAVLSSDVVKATASSRQTENASESNSDEINELLDDAAAQLGKSLTARLASNSIAAPAAAAELVTITLNVEAADLVIPDIRIDDKNTVSISEGKFKVSPLNVSVEVDGVTVGTAPGAIKLRPGFTKLRLTREGYKTWEKTINAVNGQTLTASMILSDEGYARWKDATSFLNDVKNGAKLTDAQVKVLEGQAKMLEQSGFKVDTHDAPAIHVHSLFAQ